MKILLISLLLLLSACGTIGARKNIIPVDSTPRGALVYDHNDEKIGTSPFLHVVDKSFVQTFTFKSEDDTDTEYYFCGLNWGESVVPNILLAPFFPIGTAISGIFLGVDLATGSLFRCESPVIGNLESNSPKNQARKILALPINTFDSKESDSIINRFSADSGIKSDFISNKDANYRLAYYGISNEHPANLKTISKDHLYSIAKDLNATHVAVFDKDKNRVSPKLVDIFTMKPVDDDNFKPYEVPDEIKQTPSLLRRFGQAFNFLPNSMTLSYQITDQLAAEKSGYDDDIVNDELDKHPNAAPAVFSMWGFENISNPMHFSPWDFEFKFSPAFGNKAFQYNSGNYSLTAQRATLTFDSSVTLHTPLGAFMLLAGFGPSYSYGDDNEGNNHNDFNLIVPKVSVEYYAFFKERFFMKLKVETFSIKDNEFENSKVKFNSLSGGSISLGYYIPHMKSLLRSWLPF
jgi:hypothetical protein